MHRKSKIIFKEWFYIIAAWIMIMYFYFFITFWALSDLLKPGIILEYINNKYSHLEIIIFGILFGLLLSVINTVTDKTSLHKKSFGFIIFLKSILYFVSLVIVIISIYGIYYFSEIIPYETLDKLAITITPKYAISLIIYIIFFILLTNFIIQVNKKFGPGNLFKLIMGKYHKPREENRIFMFIDLKGSTSLAERLGHNNYSRMLQNCFNDLTDIVIKYKADIYQYVGDEVVLCWSEKNGLKDLNCIKAFFAFELKLLARKKFYLKHFNTVPEFKGGMDMGCVTVAEIGNIKREIAYHGDVLNTASRIQGQCKVLNQKLLISENLKTSLPDIKDFEEELIGEVSLRGKEKAVMIYSLDLI